MSKDQKTTEHQLEQVKSPAQRAVLDAIGYGDDLPEMDISTYDDLLRLGVIEVHGDSYRMPVAVHKAWFSAMIDSENDD